MSHFSAQPWVGDAFDSPLILFERNGPRSHDWVRRPHFKYPLLSCDLNCTSLQVSTCPSLIGNLTRVAFCLSTMELLTTARNGSPTVPGFATILAGLMSLIMNSECGTQEDGIGRADSCTISSWPASCHSAGPTIGNSSA